MGGVAAAQVARGASDELPWSREAPLREAARTVSVEGALQPRCPQPSGWYPGGPAMLISNPDIKASIWGPPERITLSLMKPDVFDRRVGTAPVLTLREVREGAFAPANKNYDDQTPDRIRPGYGCLVPEGGRRERYAYWAAYPFPCQKPVGQIILGCDSLAGVEPGKLVRSCADGVVSLRAGAADVRILLSMTRNVFAVNGRFPHAAAPVWVRVYRHRDQAHQFYMTADGRAFVRPAKAAPGSREQAVIDYDFEADRGWNGPVDAPASGRDGRYFWVRQRLPAEKTFPGGFDYVLMGVVGAPSQARIETADERKGLGTPPYAVSGMSRTMDQNYAAIREATGSAATASIACRKSDRCPGVLHRCHGLRGAGRDGGGPQAPGFGPSGGFCQARRREC